MTIPTFSVDIDMPGHQIYLKFRDQDKPALFVSVPKAVINARNFDLAAEILRRNTDETSMKLVTWLETLSARHEAKEPS